MWYRIAMFLARMLFKMFRGSLTKAIHDPKRDWDERTMAAVDAWFTWQKKGGRPPVGVPAFEDRGEEISQE